MRKHFMAGFAILLPLLLTVMIVSFLVNLLTQPFLSLTELFLTQIGLFQHSFLFFDKEILTTLTSKLLILACLVGVIFLIGLLGKLFLIDYFFSWGDYFLHRVPVINNVYKASKDVVHSVFSSQSSSFKYVVLAPFPSTKQLSIGLVVKEVVTFQSDEKKESNEWRLVFVPAAPNPSVGFLLHYKKEDLQFVNMKVDEAMKFIVSCGVVHPNF